MSKGCGIIKAKAVKAYSRNPRSSMTVYEAKTRRRPPGCIEESETTALVFLLKEYWRVAVAKIYNSIRFHINKKGDYIKWNKRASNPKVLAPKSIACTTTGKLTPLCIC